MFFAFVAAAALASPSTTEPRRIIDVDGEKVSFSAAVAPDGTRRLYGERSKDGERFEFSVSPNGRVTGYVGSTKVEFRKRAKRS